MDFIIENLILSFGILVMLKFLITEFIVDIIKAFKEKK